MTSRILWGACALLGAIIFLLFRSFPSNTDAPPIQFTIPAGASFTQVVDTLSARRVVGTPFLFRVLARLRRDDRAIQAGVYEVPLGVRWIPLLDQLVDGRVVTVPLTIPEGFTLNQIADRIATFTGQDIEAVNTFLLEAPAEEWEVPGPGLEGYLFPDTYLFTPGVDLTTIVRTMVERYQSFWTPEWRARAEELGFTEREITTLASIVQGEARRTEEMPTISGVFHNRLRIGYLLQADPTVQYALEARRNRLLYADIDSVADHPYNTYTQPGLPPGPIGSPGREAIEAALHPATHDFLYFVARPDGTHIFTSSLEAHNQARGEARRGWDEAERNAEAANSGTP